MTDLYYIQSCERGNWGGTAYWWKPKRQGYTINLSEAGKYSHDEALEICHKANVVKENERMYPCNAVDAVSFPVVAEYDLAQINPTGVKQKESNDDHRKD